MNRKGSKSLNLNIQSSNDNLFNNKLYQQFKDYYHVLNKANFRYTQENFRQIKTNSLKDVDMKQQRLKVLQELKEFQNNYQKSKKNVKSITNRQKQILLKNLENNTQYYLQEQSQRDIQLANCMYPDNNFFLQQSKNMQFNYEYGNGLEKYQIMLQCLENIEYFYKDKYKNYILQKIIELGNQEHILLIYQKIKQNFGNVIYDKYGAKVIIKVIEYIYQNRHICVQENQELQETIFNNYLENIMTHENGNFIVQKMIEIYKNNDLDKLIKIIEKNIISLCLNKYGCLIIQKFIDIFGQQQDKESKVYLDSIVNKILESGMELSFKEYSNYIIQHILETKKKEYQDYILYKILLNNFVKFATDQYGSNVAEKAIVNSDGYFKKQVWKQLTNKNIINIVNNKFGNYVMQKFYQYSYISIQHNIYHILKNNHQSLSNEGRFVWKTIIKQSENNYTNYFQNF